MQNISLKGLESFNIEHLRVELRAPLALTSHLDSCGELAYWQMNVALPAASSFFAHHSSQAGLVPSPAHHAERDKALVSAQVTAFSPSSATNKLWTFSYFVKQG